MQSKLCSAIVLGALALPGGAWAAVPGQCNLPAQAHSLRGQAAIKVYLAHLESCLGDAQFLGELGDLYIEAGQYPEASEHLERALLINPELKSVQLSYAIALAGVGDPASSQALLDVLLADPTMPPQLKAALRARHLQPQEAVHVSRWTVSGRWGRDSNLLSAPNLAELALTLPSQTVVLPLDPSFLAQPGQYLRTDLQYEYRITYPGGARWDWSASHHNWYSPTESLAGANQTDVFVEYNYLPMGADPRQGAVRVGHYLNASASHLTSRASVEYTATALGAGLLWSPTGGLASSCRVKSGFELHERSHKNNEVLSARYTGLSAGVTCEPANGIQWVLGAKLGRDTPYSEDRPGGEQDQLSVRTALVAPVRAIIPSNWKSVPGRGEATLVADLDATYIRDALGYSPLLDSGRSRKTLRVAARFEYQQPISKTNLWAVGFEAAQQRANLSLFQIDSAGPYLAWRANW